MAAFKGVVSIVSGLKMERKRLANQLKRMDEALLVLGRLNGGSSYAGSRRSMSVAARKKISLAQKARWAKQQSNGQSRVARPKRTMSVAGRRKIAAAQRARWAKVRAEKKAA